MKKIYFFLMALAVSTMYAQDGSLNLSYVPVNSNPEVTAMARLSDGSIIYASRYTDSWGDYYAEVKKLNPDGTLNSSFNFTESLSTIFSICIQADDKILIGGYFGVIRLDTTGAVDNTFINPSDSNSVTVYDIVLQPVTNKILIATGGGTVHKGVYRLNVNDGSIDNTFNTNGGGVIGGFGFDRVHDIETYSNGEMIIVGKFFSYNGGSRKGMAKLNADGTLNATVFPDFVDNTNIKDAAIQTDGKIVVVGGNNTATTIEQIIRFNANGTHDTSFSGPTGASFTLPIRSVELQADGKIIIGGKFQTLNSLSRRGIARLNTNGSVDTCFDPGFGLSDNATLGNGEAFDLLIQPDKKILVAGVFSYYNGTPRSAIARVYGQTTIDAVPDNGTVPDTGGTAVANVLANDFINDSAATTSNVILTQVSTTHTNVTLNTLNGAISVAANTPSGTYYVTYKICQASCYCDTAVATIIVSTPPIGPGSRANHRVSESALQSDGKIIITGYFQSYNIYSANSIARLNNNLTFDTTFLSTGPVPAQLDARDIEVQPDDKIIVVGLIDGYNGANTGNNIVRLNSNGSLDSTFNPGGQGATGTIGNGAIQSSALQTDGKIIIGGHFTHYNGVPMQYIGRLNPNGTPDNTFVVGTGFSNSVTEVALQGSKVIVTGPFGSYNGTLTKNIVRLNSNGSLDTTFNPGGAGIGYLTSGTTTYGQIEAIYPQPNGTIYLVGVFIAYNGVSRNNIVRLNPNGTLDTSFNPGTGFDGITRTIAVEPDGKIVVGGTFTTYNGVAVNNIVRLNPNGSLDTSFSTGTGPSGAVWTLTRQFDSKIIVGGQFINFNGIYAGNITRINPAIPGNQSRGVEVWESEPVIENIAALQGGDITIYPNPSTGIFNLSFGGNGNEKLEFVIYNSLGQLLHQGTVSPETANQIDLSRFENGNYYIRLQNGQRTINKIVTKK